MNREDYLGEYLKLIDTLCERYHSRCWFATYTASKNREDSKLFDGLYGCVSSGVFPRPRRRFPYLTFLAVSALRTLRVWVRSVFVKILFAPVVDGLRGSSGNYLIRSCFYLSSVDNDGRYRDQFFTSLPDYLARQGRDPVIIGSIFSSRYFAVAGNLRRTKGRRVIPQECFVSFLDPVRAFCYILLHRVRIRAPVHFMGREISDLVRYHLDRDSADKAFEQILAFYIMRNLIKTFGVTTFAFIYENNPWEKIALEAVKQFSPGTRTIGYQHTVVSQAKLTTRLGVNEVRHMPLPDRVVANGTVTRDLLIKLGNYPPAKVVAGPALRFDRTVALKPRSAGLGRTVLLAPTAFYSSAQIVTVAHRAFKDRKDYTVIIRTHPGLSLEKMRPYLDIDPGRLPGNFRVSDIARANDDIARSDFVLYDESSLGLNALLMGVPAIYIRSDYPVSLDPLFDCADLKAEAADAPGLIAAVERYSRLDKEQFEREQAAARRYAERYLGPVDDGTLQLFL